MIKKRNQILFAIMCFLSTTGFLQLSREHNPSQWREFALRDGGFSVLLPDNMSSPEYLDTELPAAKQSGKIAGHRVIGYEGDAKYMVDYYDLPPRMIDGYLKDAREGVIKRARGMLLSCRTISLGAYPGIEYAVRSRDEFALVRHYVVKQRLFILTATMRGDGKAPADVERFVDSFKLLGTGK